MTTVAHWIQPDDYTEQSMFALLRGFGVDEAEARELAFAPIADCGRPQGVVFEKVV